MKKLPKIKNINRETIADDIISGLQCSWCGVCFLSEHGYPVACKSCWQDALREVKKEGHNVRKNASGEIIMINGVQKAIEKEL